MEAHTQQYVGVESDQYSSLLFNLLFGSDLTGYPKSSTVTVTVRDGLDNATMANTYAVNWHLPVEMWTLLSSVPTTNRIYPALGTDLSGATSIEPNRTVNYKFRHKKLMLPALPSKQPPSFLPGLGRQPRRCYLKELQQGQLVLLP